MNYALQRIEINKFNQSLYSQINAFSFLKEENKEENKVENNEKPKQGNLYTESINSEDNEKDNNNTEQISINDFTKDSSNKSSKENKLMIIIIK